MPEPVNQSMGESVVIVATSVDAPAYERELQELAEATGASLAYLQAGVPSLTDELDRLRTLGAHTFVLAGLSIGARAPARSWIRRVAAHWLREHPDASIELANKPVTGREAPLQSPAWEEVPKHRRQLFVCRGPRCSARGSAEVSAAFAKAMSDRELDDDDVLMTQTGCLFPCNHAPVVVVHPDDVWYGQVQRHEAERIVDEHLIDGLPIDASRLSRSPRNREENS